jgi:hypothetical protein
LSRRRIIIKNLLELINICKQKLKSIVVVLLLDRKKEQLSTTEEFNLELLGKLDEDIIINEFFLDLNTNIYLDTDGTHLNKLGKDKFRQSILESLL